MESHARDLENYLNVARNKRRRAKALLDFERHDDDELGFRKNDIITVSIHTEQKTKQWLKAGVKNFAEHNCFHLIYSLDIQYKNNGKTDMNNQLNTLVFPEYDVLLTASLDHLSEGWALLGGGAEWVEGLVPCQVCGIAGREE